MYQPRSTFCSLFAHPNTAGRIGPPLSPTPYLLILDQLWSLNLRNSTVACNYKLLETRWDLPVPCSKVVEQSWVATESNRLYTFTGNKCYFPSKPQINCRGICRCRQDGKFLLKLHLEPLLQIEVYDKNNTRCLSGLLPSVNFKAPRIIPAFQMWGPSHRELVQCCCIFLPFSRGEPWPPKEPPDIPSLPRCSRSPCDVQLV